MTVQPCRAGTVTRPTRRASVGPGTTSKKVKEEQSEILNLRWKNQEIHLQESLKFMNTSHTHKSNHQASPRRAPQQRRAARSRPTAGGRGAGARDAKARGATEVGVRRPGRGDVCRQPGEGRCSRRPGEGAMQSAARGGGRCGRWPGEGAMRPAGWRGKVEWGIRVRWILYAAFVGFRGLD
jgi:hypothetical protein